MISHHDDMTIGPYHEEAVLDTLPAISSASVTPANVAHGATVQLAASGTDPDGDTLSYAWDLDGDLIYETMGQNPSVSTTSLTPGTRPVRVRALNPWGGYALASTTLTVTPLARLAFSVQPGGGQANTPLVPRPVVQAVDDQGRVAPAFSGPVTVSLAGNTGSATLGGTTTVNAVNGVATFTNLSVTAACTDCTLIASAAGLTSATSTPFTMTGTMTGPPGPPGPPSPPDPALCTSSARPAVGVTATPSNPGQLSATIAAQQTPAIPGNALSSITITRVENAVVVVNGAPASSGVTVPVAGGTSPVTMLVIRQTAGQPSTVAFTAMDACGAWPTFVGGGPGAF